MSTTARRAASSLATTRNAVDASQVTATADITIVGPSRGIRRAGGSDDRDPGGYVEVVDDFIRNRARSSGYVLPGLTVRARLGLGYPALVHLAQMIGLASLVYLQGSALDTRPTAIGDRGPDLGASGSW
jgi:hypothetical protein